MHKNMLFLLKNCKNLPDLGALSPDPMPPAAGVRHQTPNGLRRLRAPTKTPPLKNLGYATVLE